MFCWLHEFSFEVNHPLQKVWDFGINPSNWPKWSEKIESCHCEGKLQPDSLIKVKVKSRFPQDVYIPIKLKEIEPYRECKLLIKVPLLIIP